MSTGCFFVTPFNYSAGYPTGYPAKQIGRISGGRISGQFSIRCHPTYNLRIGVLFAWKILLNAMNLAFFLMQFNSHKKGYQIFILSGF